jgi:hypothetical protein
MPSWPKDRNVSAVKERRFGSRAALQRWNRIRPNTSFVWQSCLWTSSTTGTCNCHKTLKLSHYTPWRRLGERRYSSYSFSTSALDRGKWSASRPGRVLSPEKGPPIPIVQEAGWAPEPVWTQRIEEKSFRLCRGSNLDRPVVQPVLKTLYWLSYPAHL